MAKTLTLELSDNTYDLLVKTSSNFGQTPEEMIMELVKSRVKEAAQDPLLQLAGIFEAGSTAARHDEYIGQALRKDERKKISPFRLIKGSPQISL
jgi:hypothetical protein